jgi:hypothetical protein
LERLDTLLCFRHGAEVGVASGPWQRPESTRRGRGTTLEGTDRVVHRLVGQDQDLGVREQDGIGIREDRGIRFIREEDGVRVVLRRRVGAERQEATREGKIDVGFRRVWKQEGRRAKQLLRHRPALDGEAAGEQARREDGGFGEYRLAPGEKHKTSDGSSPGGGEDAAQAAGAGVLRHGGKALRQAAGVENWEQRSEETKACWSRERTKACLQIEIQTGV